MLEAARLLAVSLGHGTDAGTAIVADVLTYLGIYAIASASDYSVGLATTAHLDTPIPSDASRECFQSKFDPESKQWRISSQSFISLDDKQPPLIHLANHEAPLKNHEHDTCASITHQPRLHDWTTLLPRTEHVQFVKSRNWAATSLGPMQEWPSALRLMTLKMLAEPRPANLYWGEDYVSIYNEKFVALAGDRHPLLMGSAAQTAVPATWPFLSRVFEEVKRTRIAFSTPEFEMSVEKIQGSLEEAWYDGQFSPITGADGEFLGLYNSGFEITDRIITQRRSALLHRIWASPTEDETPWQRLLIACQDYDRDVPLLVVYSASSYDTPQSQSCSLHLEGCIGVEAGHPAAPTDLELHHGSGGFIPALRLAKARKCNVLVEDLPQCLLDLSSERGHADVITHIVISPIFLFGSIAGYIITGLNPRLPYNQPHKQFVEDLGRLTTGLLSSSVSAEQVRARAETLSEQLTAKEKFIRTVAEVASVGLYSINLDGLITWANSNFYTITGFPDTPESAYNWACLDTILDEDKERSIGYFTTCIAEQIPVTFEIRVKREWEPKGCAKELGWILVSIIPMIDDETVIGILGCITDISNLKWSEQLQINIAEAATEAKRQQERFVDITSHEIRNPLSAMLQSADDICQIAQENLSHQSSTGNENEGLERVLENAQTIIFCAEHQKRIIDDILTVSKLDSSMLTIAPSTIDACTVAKRALHMFEREFIANEIVYSFSVKQTYTDQDINLVLCDGSRLSQVLINLITNAIKFTKTEATREIHLRVGGSLERPPEGIDGLKWFPSVNSKGEKVDHIDSKDEVYLTFEVQDSGKGISEEEMSKLFNRFSQASPMTYVEYGGSGLGLFISREMTELQGGMIGTRSAPGEGSTFAFFIRTKKTTSDDTPKKSSSGLENHNHKRTISVRKKEQLREEIPDSQIINPNSEIKNSRGTPTTLSKTSRSPANGKDYEAPLISKSHVSILLVEDNVLNQKVLTKQLQRLGHTVHIANHGLEALEFMETTCYWHKNDSGHVVDVILMDWEMPLMDGLLCTKKLKDMELQGLLTKHIPIIGTTANARLEQVQTALTAGMDDVIAKPFTVSTLVERINRFMGPCT